MIKSSQELRPPPIMQALSLGGCSTPREEINLILSRKETVRPKSYRAMNGISWDLVRPTKTCSNTLKVGTPILSVGRSLDGRPQSSACKNDIRIMGETPNI